MSDREVWTLYPGAFMERVEDRENPRQQTLLLHRHGHPTLALVVNRAEFARLCNAYLEVEEHPLDYVFNAPKSEMGQLVNMLINNLQHIRKPKKQHEMLTRIFTLLAQSCEAPWALYANYQLAPEGYFQPLPPIK